MNLLVPRPTPSMLLLLALTAVISLVSTTSTARAYTNEVHIAVAKHRLWQCGAGWDPEHTGWTHATGTLYVNGEKVHSYNLSDPKECSRDIRVTIDAKKDVKIWIKLVDNDGLQMESAITTVAADRVWLVEWFVDQLYGKVLSTNWPAAPGSSPGGTPTTGQGDQVGEEPPAADVDLALNKPATASGTYSSYAPRQANDGDRGTIWNGGSNTACWSVDLQKSYAVSTIVVGSNQFGAGGLRTVFQVSSSSDGATWDAVGAAITASGDQRFEIDAGGRSMRHVRYCTIAGSTNWATLGELAVYGGHRH